MKWNIEELVEDAFKAYLQSQVTGSMRVYVAWGFNDPQFPCAVVHVADSEPVSEEAEWNDNRMMSVSVAVLTENAPETDSSGNTLRTAREINAAARSDVMNALATSSLLTNLIATGTEKVAFSMAQLMNSSRDIAERENTLQTILTLAVIAEPVEDS